METFLQAAILALALEGVGFVLFPKVMARTMAEISRMPTQALRSLGGAALALCALLAFLLRALR